MSSPRSDPASRKFALACLGIMGVLLMSFGVEIGMQSCSTRNDDATIAPSFDTIFQAADENPRFSDARRLMVQMQLRDRDITDPRVLAAMSRVPRQLFVPKDMQLQAYSDRALPIEEKQTISQPYIVALMTQSARPTANSRALEIGTGSGYQAAVLAELCREVYSIEILKPLADAAQKRLAALGYKNITLRQGDGYRGWHEHAPFDLILVTAAPGHVPPSLIEQLAVGGRLVIPVGRPFQELLLLEKRPDGTIQRKTIAPVLFVPMTGEAQK